MPKISFWAVETRRNFAQTITDTIYSSISAQKLQFLVRSWRRKLLLVQTRLPRLLRTRQITYGGLVRQWDAIEFMQSSRTRSTTIIGTPVPRDVKIMYLREILKKTFHKNREWPSPQRVFRYTQTKSRCSVKKVFTNLVITGCIKRARAETEHWQGLLERENEAVLRSRRPLN